MYFLYTSCSLFHFEFLCGFKCLLLSYASTYHSRHNTLSGEISGFTLSIFHLSIHAMAHIDGVVLTPEQMQIQQLQTQIQQLVGQLQHLQPNPVPQIVPPPNRPNLNLPMPPYYSGNPLELNTFKIKLTHYLQGNFNTFFDDQSRLMCAGALLSGLAQQWYETLIDPITSAFPNHYTLDAFLDELTAFFGGGLTMASREHSLDDLR